MWMTVETASQKWKISKRTVQHLCKAGKIQGATHFNRAWAIPSHATRPVKASVSENRQENHHISPPPKHILELADFELILDQYPYSMHISRADGTMVFANKLFFEGALEEVRNSAIGQYNIFLEPQLEAWGLKEHVLKAFQGEHVTTKMLKFPNKELVDIRYSKDYGFINIYQDITSIPIFDVTGHLSYVVTLFMPSKKHYERSEVMAAKSYIDTHWMETLSISSIAKHVNLSVSRLASLFKGETGFTLHDYYHDIKMRHVCDLLTRGDLLISEVFNQCGIAYNSHYSSLFKVYTGMTPRAYRLHKTRLKR